MKQATRNHFNEIIQCGYTACWDSLCNNSSSECSKLVSSQQLNNNIANFHLPEPWNGDIENAEIVFLGPNPGYDSDEFFPTPTSNYWNFVPNRIPSSVMEDFFENRFSPHNRAGINNPYVRIEDNNTKYRTLRANTIEYPKRAYTGYWKYIYEIADYEIFQKSGKHPTPGVEYCVTEVARCKSTSTNGVNINKCVARCAKKYLLKTLSLATNMKLLVVVGGLARDVVYNLLDGQICKPDMNSCQSFAQVTLPEGQKVDIVFIPHNNARGVNRGTLSKYKTFHPKGLLK